VSPKSLPENALVTSPANQRELSSSNRRLAEQEAKNRAILDSAIDAIVSINDRGIIESVNPATATMFGYSESELIGSNVSILMPEPYAAEHDRYVANYLMTGIKKIIGIGREVMGRRKDGTQFPAHLAVGEIIQPGRRAFTGIIRDISDLEAAHRRIVQSERLALLGEAAARLAHECRNSLQRIQLAAGTARLATENSPPVLKQLEVIERCGEEISALLTEVRNYAAPLHLEKLPTNLAEVLQEAWQSLAQVRRRKIAFLYGEHTTAIKCSVDRFRIVQVFRNLLENSLAVCPEPAEIEISTSVVDSEDQAMVEVIFCDNGPGLDPEHQLRIFEPFFTTKSKGTGLGMAIARRIVEAHGGTISAGSGASGGAEFRVRLPLSSVGAINE
jgi:two-component system sensor kinase FixL